MPEYKFNEGKILEEIKTFIDKTYGEHYSGKESNRQVLEDIIEDGHGIGFTSGNIYKYSRRYGKKGETPSDWRKDLMKVIHYSIILLYLHDKEHSESKNIKIIGNKVSAIEDGSPFYSSHVNNLDFADYYIKYNDGTHNAFDGTKNAFKWFDNYGNYDRHNGPAYIDNEKMIWYSHGEEYYKLNRNENT